MVSAPFTLRELAGQRWLLPPHDIQLRGWVDALFLEAGIGRPTVFIESDATPAVFTSLVRQTDLLTVLTDDSLRSTAGAGLVTLPAPARSWTTRIGLFWRRAAYFSRLMQDCRNALAEQAAQRGRLAASDAAPSSPM